MGRKESNQTNKLHQEMTISSIHKAKIITKDNACSIKHDTEALRLHKIRVQNVSFFSAISMLSLILIARLTHGLYLGFFIGHSVWPDHLGVS